MLDFNFQTKLCWIDQGTIEVIEQKIIDRIAWGSKWQWALEDIGTNYTESQVESHFHNIIDGTLLRHDFLPENALDKSGIYKLLSRKKGCNLYNVNFLNCAHNTTFSWRCPFTVYASTCSKYGMGTRRS
mgnify:CR=1 FL=1